MRSPDTPDDADDGPRLHFEYGLGPSASGAPGPEILTVVSGATTADGEGCVTIDLPEGYVALHREIHGRVTLVHSARVLVIDPVEENRTVIDTGVPWGRVRWAVTGMQRDLDA